MSEDARQSCFAVMRARRVAKRKIPMMVRHSNVVCSGHRMSKDIRSDTSTAAMTMSYRDTGIIVEDICSKENGCEIVKQAELPSKTAGLKSSLQPPRPTEATLNITNWNSCQGSAVRYSSKRST